MDENRNTIDIKYPCGHVVPIPLTETIPPEHLQCPYCNPISPVIEDHDSDVKSINIPQESEKLWICNSFKICSRTCRKKIRHVKDNECSNVCNVSGGVKNSKCIFAPFSDKFVEVKQEQEINKIPWYRKNYKNHLKVDKKLKEYFKIEDILYYKVLHGILMGMGYSPHGASRHICSSIFDEYMEKDGFKVIGTKREYQYIKKDKPSEVIEKNDYILPKLRPRRVGTHYMRSEPAKTMVVEYFKSHNSLNSEELLAKLSNMGYSPGSAQKLYCIIFNIYKNKRKFELVNDRGKRCIRKKETSQ